MSYADYGLDTTKKSEDEGKTGCYYCPWCNKSDVGIGFSLCFSNFCICNDCVAVAPAAKDRWRVDDGSGCFKCSKGKDSKNYSLLYYDTSGTLSICMDCLKWAEDVFEKQKQFEVKIMEEVNEILSRCTVEGVVVKLPDELLDRKLYQEVAKKLQLIGGKWKGGKVAGFVFEQDPTELLADIANGDNRNLKKEYQFFPTPENVAFRMMNRLPLSKIDFNTKILEPSAGSGSLIKALVKSLDKPCPTVDCFEIMDLNRKKLQQVPHANLIGEDFLEAEGLHNQYDIIIANPPFAKNQDIDHIQKMMWCLKPGGTMVTLASPSFTIGEQKKQIQFREWLQERNAVTEEIEAGAFKQSGTSIKTFMIIMEKTPVEGIVTDTPSLNPAIVYEEATSVVEPEVQQSEPAAATRPAAATDRKKAKSGTTLVISNKMLKDCFKTVKDIVPRKPVVPALENVIFSASGSILTVMATDLEVTLIMQLELAQDMDKEFIALIPFAWLNSICNLHEDEPLSFEFKGKKLTISGENDCFDHNGLEDFSKYPELPEISRENTVVIGAELVDMLNAALITCDLADDKTVFRSKVNLEITKSAINVASTNGRVLYTNSMAADAAFETDVMLSQKLIKCLAGFKETSIYWNEKFMAFETERVKVITVRPEGKFVNWRSIVPTYESNLAVNRQDLLQALNKIFIVNGNDCLFNLQKNGVKITAKDDSYGRNVVVDLSVEEPYTGTVDAIMLSPSLMQKLFSQVDDSEIQLAIHDATKPVLLRSNNEESYLGLIVPLTLS